MRIPTGITVPDGMGRRRRWGSAVCFTGCSLRDRWWEVGCGRANCSPCVCR